jgi:hypothetical protein
MNSTTAYEKGMLEGSENPALDPAGFGSFEANFPVDFIFILSSAKYSPLNILIK